MGDSLKLPPIKKGSLVGSEDTRKMFESRLSIAAQFGAGRRGTVSTIIPDDAAGNLALTEAMGNAGVGLSGTEEPVQAQPVEVDGSKKTTLLQKLEESDSGPTNTADEAKNRAGRSTPDTDRKLRAVQRFRKVARMIKMNLAWTRDMREQHEDDHAFTISSGDDGKESVTFDVNNFKVKNRTYGGLTVRARRILSKAPMDRTEADVLVLKDVVDRLNCFEKYPRNVRHELARVICYDKFEDGRIIIQQGHMGLSFYFIVSGKVSIRVAETDKKTGQRVVQICGELSDGQSFGELALIHNIRRAASIICKGTVQLLRVDKDDFGDVLRMNYQKGWQQRYNALHWLPRLQHWSEEEIKMCTNSSQLEEFAQDKVIMGNTTEAPEFIYFILSGEVRIIREMKLVLSTTNKWGAGTQLTLPTSSQAAIINRIRNKKRRRGTMPFKVKHCFWTVCNLDKGLFFGTGEDLTDTYLVTLTRVECLLIPRLHFHKQGRLRMLDQMRIELQAVILSNEEILQRYIEDCNWERYKQEVVNEVIQRRAIPNKTTKDDVPKAARSTSPIPLDPMIKVRHK